MKRYPFERTMTDESVCLYIAVLAHGGVEYVTDDGAVVEMGEKACGEAIACLIDAGFFKWPRREEFVTEEQRREWSESVQIAAQKYLIAQCPDGPAAHLHAAGCPLGTELADEINKLVGE